eukprot:140878_1
MFSFIFFLLTTLTAQLTRDYVWCNSPYAFTDTIGEGDSFQYNFYIEHLYNVNIHTCSSSTDIIISVQDQAGSDISNQYCIHGDACGKCRTSSHNIHENFTIPMMQAGTYLIGIKPYILGGEFSMKISCIDVENNTVIANTFVESYNTTSVTSEVQKLLICSHYTNNTFIIASPNTVFRQISIINDSIGLEFQIKLNHYCKQSSCNILCFKNELGSEYLSLSINATSNNFRISILNASSFSKHYMIPNANILLPVDNQFHNISLSYSYNFKLNDGFKITLKIDGFVHYYHSVISFSSFNYIYQLFMSDSYESSINASVRDICIKSPVSTNLFVGEIKCGDWLSRKQTEHNIAYYYYFTMSDNLSYLLFDACWSWDPHLYLYDIDFNILVEGNSDDCIGEKLLVTSPSYGEYILAINTIRLDVQVSCEFIEDSYNHTYTIDPALDDLFQSDYHSNNDEYILMDISGFSAGYLDWFNAEETCEQECGTSLATIITQDDLVEALSVFRQLNQSNVSVWIGLNQLSGRNWQWIDGTSCNYTISGDCADDNHWAQNEPDNLPTSAIEHYGAILLFSGEGNYSIIYDQSFMNSASATLCTGSNSKYNIKSCSTFNANCWQGPELLSTDNYIRTDMHHLRSVKVAYWQSKLFVIGNDKIHYTNFALYNNQYEWHHILLDKTETWSYDPRFYVQYRAVLYMYVEIVDLGKYLGQILVQIDLNTLNVTHRQITLPDTFSTVNCLQANADHVYFISTQGNILSYKIEQDDWRLSVDDHAAENIEKSVQMNCAITNDNKFIYIFRASYFPYKYGNHYIYVVTKYDINHSKFYSLNISNLCMRGTIGHTTVTGGNGKIFFSGCYIASWQTLIFNPETDQFENQTIDIATPNKKDFPYYAESQLAVFDDNILLRIYKNWNDFFQLMDDQTFMYKFSVYFSTTELISINFTNTETTFPIWPSDGFDIKYYLNDFSDFTRNMYNMWFYSIDTRHDINASITLDKFNDNCICNETIYNCYNCTQHFDLKKYITLIDNNVSVLKFTPTYHGFGNGFEVLILPRNIKFQLQRCSISFHDFDDIIMNNQSRINFSFSLSPNCYTRVGTNFSLNITSLSVNISQQLFITIIDNSTKKCKICQTEHDNCYDFENNNFVIYHKIDGNENKVFDIMIESNMIDFRVNTSTKNTFKHIVSTDNLRTVSNKQLLNLLYLLLLPFIVVLIFFFYCRRQYLNAFIVDKALVLIIGISQFDDKKKFLPGVSQNVQQLTDLWKNKYNYDVFVCNAPELYSTKLDVIAFVDEHI